jgi:hypothetical protein
MYYCTSTYQIFLFLFLQKFLPNYDYCTVSSGKGILGYITVRGALGGRRGGRGEGGCCAKYGSSCRLALHHFA